LGSWGKGWQNEYFKWKNDFQHSTSFKLLSQIWGNPANDYDCFKVHNFCKGSYC
jgi:hypothetical protein